MQAPNALSSASTSPASSSTRVTLKAPGDPPSEPHRGQTTALPSTTDVEVACTNPSTFNVKRTTESQPQTSQRGTARWIVSSSVPTRPISARFKAHITHLRRQFDSTTTSSPDTKSILLLGSCSLSIPSTPSESDSQSQVVASPPPLPVVDFPPTPDMKDHTPKWLSRKVDGHRTDSDGDERSTPIAPMGSYRRAY